MAEARTTGSLPVANVQELAKACNGDGQVPERYLSKDPTSAEEAVIVAGEDDGACAIPVIDFHRLLDPRSSEECTKLASACRHWGFFQACN